MAVTKEIAEREERERAAIPDPSSDVQIAAASRAIIREYGNVIGENQARNIAYHALVGARGAVFAAMKKS